MRRPRFRDWSLRTKLAAFLLVVSVVPVALIAILDVRQTKSRIFDSETALLAARADQLTGELDGFNRGYQRAAERLAGVPEIGAFLVATQDESERLLAPLELRLRVHIGADPAVRGIAVIDAAGRVSATTEASLAGHRLLGHNFIRKALGGLAVVSDVFVAEPEIGDVPTIAFCSPVLGAAGHVLGLVAFWVRADALWDIASRSNGLVGKGSFAVMFDRFGIRIAHTFSREIVFRPAGALPPDEVEALVAEQRFGIRTRALLDDVRAFPEQFTRARAAALDLGLFHGTGVANGKLTYGVARRPMTAPWTIFYMVPADALSSPIVSATRERILFAVIVGFAALLAGAGFARVIATPIGKLTAATKALASGDLTVRVDAGRRDEVGSLASSFNSMADEIGRAHGGLEAKVAERTADLLEANRSLREREQNLATTLTSIGDAVIVTDAKGIVVRVNPVAERLTGWSAAEASGRPLEEVFRIINEDTRAPIESPAQRVLRDGAIVGLANHTVVLSRDGSECPISDSAAPIVDSDSTISGVVLVFRGVRSQRDAEQALRASEQKYRGLYEDSPDMYLTAELATQSIVDCNETLCDRLGYAKPELLGQIFHTVYHPDYRDRVATSNAAFQTTGEFSDVERVLRRKDGGSIDVSLNLRAVRDTDGRITHARAVWRDISIRKQADRDRQFQVSLGDALRSSTNVADVLSSVSARIVDHLQVAQCLFIEIDGAADRVTVRNDRGTAPVDERPLSAYGSGAIEESLRGDAVILNDVATDPRTAASYDSAFRDSGIRASMSVPLSRSGQLVSKLVVTSPIARVWQDREIALLKLAAERVWAWTEHLRVLEELREQSIREARRESEERFRVLVDAVRDYAIFMVDVNGLVTTWNSGAQRLKGYRADEIVGRPFELFYTPEDRARNHPAFELSRARAEGQYEEEGWRLRKDGTPFWASVLITPLHGSDGQVDGFAEVTKDFTERRRVEQESHERQAQLSQSLKEREVLLQEVHHRVKNNLQVISSLINMQVRKLDPGSSRDALEECQTRVLAIALIHEKLYQSKDYSQVRFAEYSRSLSANVFHTLGVSHDEVTLALAIDDIPLGIDRAIPCGLVINELITNALKHAFKGGRRGTIEVMLSRLADGRLRLAVRDDGVGLPDGFDVQKVQSMGLQLVCTLAEQLDAELVVDRVGGTTFQLTFAGG